MANSFGAQLQAYADKTGERLEDIAVDFKFELFNMAVQLTPVQTGRLRGNWQITNGAPAQGIIGGFPDRPVSEDARTALRASPLPQESRLQIQPFAVTYLTNNLVYAVAVEQKRGMVGRAIVNARAALGKAVADVS